MNWSWKIIAVTCKVNSNWLNETHLRAVSIFRCLMFNRKRFVWRRICHKVIARTTARNQRAVVCVYGCISHRSRTLQHPQSSTSVTLSLLVGYQFTDPEEMDGLVDRACPGNRTQACWLVINWSQRRATLSTRLRWLMFGLAAAILLHPPQCSCTPEVQFM